MLGDMPFILPSSVERVAAAMAEDASVCRCRRRVRASCRVRTRFGPGLLALREDHGAKPLFAQGRVVEVAVDDPGVMWDVDVPEALVFA